MDDDQARVTAEHAWEAARDLLDEEDLDGPALAVLQEADGVLSACTDDENRERRAHVLEAVVRGSVQAGDASAALESVEALLSGAWPDEALHVRLHAALIAADWRQLSPNDAISIATRAIDLGSTSDDYDCRGLVAELLKVHGDVVAQDDVALARTLWSRVIEEYADVDDPIDSAQSRLDDPYLRGRALIEQGGPFPAAEAAFRQAIDDGHDGAWLELGIVLGWQPGREDDEEQALHAALAAQTDPERLASAGNRLGCLLLYGRNDREGARAAFGRATTGEGPDAINSLQELAIIAVLDGDHAARRQLIAELAGRNLEEFDPDARRKDHRAMVGLSRLGYAKSLIAIRARRWQRERRKAQAGSREPS